MRLIFTRFKPSTKRKHGKGIVPNQKPFLSQKSFKEAVAGVEYLFELADDDRLLTLFAESLP